MHVGARSADRQAWLTVGCLFGCGGLVAGAVGAVVTLFLWVFPIPPDAGPLIREGDRLAAQVEAYRAAIGPYPPDLDAAGAAPRTSRYCGWQYAVLEDGSGFELLIGRYIEDGFVLIRSAQGEWCEDT